MLGFSPRLLRSPPAAAFRRRRAGALLLDRAAGHPGLYCTSADLLRPGRAADPPGKGAAPRRGRAGAPLHDTEDDLRRDTAGAPPPGRAGARPLDKEDDPPAGRVDGPVLRRRPLADRAGVLPRDTEADHLRDRAGVLLPGTAAARLRDRGADRRRTTACLPRDTAAARQGHQGAPGAAAPADTTSRRWRFCTPSGVGCRPAAAPAPHKGQSPAPARAPKGDSSGTRSPIGAGLAGCPGYCPGSSVPRWSVAASFRSPSPLRPGGSQS
jgi:hypothetical protein